MTDEEKTSLPPEAYPDTVVGGPGASEGADRSDFTERPQKSRRLNVMSVLCHHRVR